MNESFLSLKRSEADEVFDDARRQAFIEKVIGHLVHRRVELLSFEQVRASLGLLSRRQQGLQEIPLDRIVGSVGKYRQFTRSFLPGDKRLKRRWKSVYAAALGTQGLPPIDVYQVGDVYFVNDGNHRVSVARQFGAKSIEAYVTEFLSPVALTADTDLDRLMREPGRDRGRGR
jgi:hypothetical protein